MSKYHSKKVLTADGILHDSKKEADRWVQLSLLQKAGHISRLQRQVKFEVIPGQYEHYARYGKKGQRLQDGIRCIERPCYYVADFVYYEAGEYVVEDCKGMRTPDYIIKRKLMLKTHKIKIRET